MSAKGVKGRLHSKAVERLRSLWNLMFPLGSNAVEAIAATIKTLSASTSSGSGGCLKSAQKKSKNATIFSDNTVISLQQLTADDQAVVNAFSKADLEWKVYACGRVISFAVWRLFRHITPAYLPELWHFLLEMVGDVVRAMRTLQGVTALPAEVQALVERQKRTMPPGCIRVRALPPRVAWH